jgi:hypothetical protein
VARTKGKVGSTSKRRSGRSTTKQSANRATRSRGTTTRETILPEIRMTTRDMLAVMAADMRLIRQEVQVTRSHVQQMAGSANALQARNVELNLENSQLKAFLEKLRPESPPQPSAAPGT